jgi:hypothetical protein
MRLHHAFAMRWLKAWLWGRGRLRVGLVHYTHVRQSLTKALLKYFRVPVTCHTVCDRLMEFVSLPSLVKFVIMKNTLLCTSTDRCKDHRYLLIREIGNIP